MKELNKKYNPLEIEDKHYDKWMEKKYFHAEVDRSKKPFTVVMPPPNITGQLHMGHALDNTIQDIVIRFKRMQGYNALWQPGTDHASIATELKIIEKLKSEGTSKDDIGREEFLKYAWEWRKEYGGQIVNQLKKLGSSADWDRERFTLDEGCSKAVEEVFLRLYEKGYIYKGSKIINWCPVCKTSISDAEVEHDESNGYFWHIRYQVKDSDEFIEIATTRPETMLGDTAVAVHPDDERYKHLIGKSVILPLVNREIPVIADFYVEKDFGTGVVKITPAHDPNDFEVGKRHNLDEINIMNDDASINENGGKYRGMDRYVARKEIVSDLENGGYLVKIQDHTNNVGKHDRCNTVIEPLIKPQWFVKMDELIKPAVKAVKSGEIKLLPEHMDRLYYNWTDNIRDWCISRQLWWGHRIPAYYCQDCNEVVVSKIKPDTCPKCKSSKIQQDEDTLDTWFSSALWPFSTLGWPEKTEDLDYFYPTDLLVTGYDIIFFWVIRMIFSGYEQMGEKPYKTVLFHGLVRDSQGRKMSKSLGNGIDPLKVIEEYGADALRFTLITGIAPGNDTRFHEKKVEASRNFANKIWNASRFIMMNMPEEGIGNVDQNQLTDADKWIISKSNKLIKDVTENMEKYELGVAADKLYDFIWEEFCDWYIEMVKPRLYDDSDQTKKAALFTLKKVLITLLKLLHPYMPFITEEIFCNIQSEEESIMISDWPIYEGNEELEVSEEKVELIKEAVRATRAIRTEMNVPFNKKAKLYVVSEDFKIREIFDSAKVFFGSLSHASEVTVKHDKSGIEEDAVSVVLSKAVIYIPFEELVDISKEIEHLKEEVIRLDKEISRVKGMLSNKSFLEKAPENKIAEEKEKQIKYVNMMEKVQERLKQLGIK